jgi:ribose/xylose/arabinose/galactoside ABC-type transport system permease subunit
MAEILEKPKPSVTTAREFAKRIFRHENAILIGILIILIAMFGVLSHGKTSSAENMVTVLVQSSTRGIAAMGQTFVILTAGIDLSIGGLAILAACVGGALTGTESGAYGFGGQVYGLPMGVGIIALLTVGAGFGAFNGLSVSRLRVPPLIVTLAIWQVTTGIAYQLTGGFVIGGLPPALSFLGTGRIAGVPVPIVIFIAFGVIAYFVLHHTTFGRSVYAVGGNPVSAWLSGIRVPRILLVVYMISGVTGAIAGLVAVARVMAASMTVMAGLELDTIAAVVIGGVSLAGGRGTIIGAIIGTIIIGVINNGLNILGVGAGVQEMVKGIIIYTAVTIDMQRRR